MPATTDTAKIREEEMLHISYDRVNKIDAPLMIVGLGGTGADIVRTVKATLARRFVLPENADGTPILVPSRTGYLVLDTDKGNKSGLENDEFFDFTSSSALADLADAKHERLTPEEKGWIHRDLHIKSMGASSSSGAGTFRSVSRLMLERNYAGVREILSNKLNSLVSKEAGQSGIEGAAQIVVATGIGGGTGSGTFLDVGQIIREIMRTGYGGIPYNLTCYLVMPDLTIKHLSKEHTTAMLPIVRQNGYAALKELDFWMDYDRHHCRYTMNYSGNNIEWVKPFDHVALMCETQFSLPGNKVSSPISDAYKYIQRTVAENLLHYMADEIVQKNEEGHDQYSFQSYENNLEAQLTTCLQKPQLLPLVHTYRAVGAFSKRIPKVKILYAEGRILFETFMPPRDDHGKLVPNNTLLTDQRANERFQFVTKKDFKRLYRDFASGVPYPKVCGAFNESDGKVVDAMRKLNTPLHDSASYEFWREKSVSVPAAKWEEAYKNEVWKAFQDLCERIMADPAFGPFSLLQYLKDPGQSLRRGFATYAANAQGMVNNLKSDVAKWRQVCENSYAGFLKPPIVGGKKAIQTYLNALRELLNTVRQYEMAKHYEQVMRLTVQYIDAYIQDALEPLCNVIEELEGDFNNPFTTADDLGSDLFAVSSLHDEITSTFEEANKQKTVSRNFLTKICNSSFDTVRNVNAGTCGRTFTFRKDGRLKAMQLVKAEMDVCFKQINSQSLDSIVLIQCANPDPSVQQENQNKFIDKLKAEIVESAAPLFSLKQTHAEIGSLIAKCNYFSVPDDSPIVLARLLNDKSITPKQSALKDHIYCNVTYDGLPLYSYAMIDDLKMAYDNAIASGATQSLHLVWNGDPDGDYQHNWGKLPDPAPFYLTRPSNPSPTERSEYKRVRALAGRALACGMMSINSTVDEPVQFPTYTFCVFRKGGMAEHVETLHARMQDVLKSVNTSEEKRSGLRQLLAQADRRTIQAAKSPMIMAAMLGLDNSILPINPFDQTIAENPVSKRQANKNFYDLTVEYATHVLFSDPTLLHDLEYQISAFEEISSAIQTIEKGSQLWGPRIAYAQRYAALYTFGLVGFDQMGNPTFANESNETCLLIQPDLFNDDLKLCKMLVKAVGAAADLKEDHPIRDSLEFRLKNKEQQWDEDARVGRLTRDDVNPQIQRLNSLLDEAVREAKEFNNTKMMDSKADQALLKNQIDLVNSVKDYAANRLEALKRIIFPDPIPDPIPEPPKPDTWTCPKCGKTGLTGKFCLECGTKRPGNEPEPLKPDTWTCPKCGKTGLTGKFCLECGTKRPGNEPETWTCPECGKTGLTGKFCLECGTKRP